MRAARFAARTRTRLDREIEAWHAAQPPEPGPVIIDHPIDTERQTGESRKLGGPMSIHAPWSEQIRDP